MGCRQYYRNDAGKVCVGNGRHQKLTLPLTVGTFQRNILYGGEFLIN